MSDVFLQLSAEDRIEALATAAAESGRPAHLLEKDVWVVWALRALFDAPLGEALVFKGGTSLSKAYDVIQRFACAGIASRVTGTIWPVWTPPVLRGRRSPIARWPRRSRGIRRCFSARPPTGRRSTTVGRSPAVFS